MVIKSDLTRPRPDLTVPVRAYPFDTEAKVPFPDYCGAIASPFHQIGKGEGIFINDKMTVRRSDAGSFFPEGIGAGEE